MTSPERVDTTILIIDDQPANLAVLVGFFESKGYDVVIAENGENGIARAKLVRPDLILLDVLMPGIDGFETCLRFKADPATAGIPVIFMTALTDGSDKVKGFEAGGMDYVTKPVQLDEVWARINTHLKLSRLEKSLRHEAAERRLAMQQLEVQMRFLHTVIDSLPYPFYVVDADTYRVVLANSLASVEYGWKDACCHDLIHGRSKPCGENEKICPLLEVKRTGGPVVVEHLHKGEDGVLRNLAVHGYPIMDETGTLVQMIVYAVDVSRRKQMEAEREEMIEKLQVTLEQVKILGGVVPICMYCKSIRDDQGYWNRLEKFISEHSEATFSHGICDDCMKEKFPDRVDGILDKE